MIANLRNYEPETIEFVVPDSIREKFPPVLFQGSTNVDELIKLVNEHFNATFPESEVTQRLLDEFEISEIREEYCIKPINRYSMRYPYTYTHNINANGNIKISNNWSLSFNSGYDFQAKEITQTSCTISRDLHCFNLSASLSPFGRWKYYNVTIRANASILQDLKYEQRSQTQSNIQWY